MPWENFWFMKLLFGLRKIHTLLKRKELDNICFYKLLFEARIRLGKVPLQVCDYIIKIFEYILLKEYIASLLPKHV